MTRVQLASALDRDPRTLSRWRTEGMPTARPGSPGVPALFDAVACSAWMREREARQHAKGADLEQARAAREHWTARLAEQTYAARQRELLPRADVERVWTAERRRITACLSRLSDHATAVAAVVDGGPVAVEAALKVAVYDVLEQLAHGA